MEETQLIQIKNRIYELRGQKVMLDSDLAMMYGIETKQLKRAVRRNIERFEGEDFMFELTKEECLRCQIGTLNGKRGEHLKYMPFAFTELGGKERNSGYLCYTPKRRVPHQRRLQGGRGSLRGTATPSMTRSPRLRITPLGVDQR